MQDQQQLQSAIVSHFSHIFNDEVVPPISDQLLVIRRYSSFFTPEEAFEVGREVTLGEVETMLKGFVKNKSLGPNG